MRPTPEPSEVGNALRRIDELRPAIIEAYRWTHPMGHARGANGSEAKRYQLGHVSDQTGEAIVSKDLSAIRAEVRTAGNLVLDAATRITGAMAALERASKAADVGFNEEPYVAAPRLVTGAELAIVRRSKDKRAARGEGYGSS